MLMNNECYEYTSLGGSLCQSSRESRPFIKVLTNICRLDNACSDSEVAKVLALEALRDVALD